MSARGKKRGSRRLMGEINVVPYIDVMLVLLIIFMVTAPLLTKGVNVSLPDKAPAQPLSQQGNSPVPLVLTVDEKGRLYLSVGDNPKEPLKPKIVVAKVAAVLKHNPKKTVLVKGDKQASYGEVVFGMTLLQTAGASQVGLVVKNTSQTLFKKEH